ncbi:MAG TPA: sigma 54-interacting transcriptional regulator [Candidatus Krumholzibacteriaceae bacterium]|nr:sigma 54-interacting transcriptional regulator [Candidatus Krumholzibacteriaceae bacterium]
MNSGIDLRNEIILNSIADGVFTVDLNWRITYLNRAAERIIGVSKEEAQGKFCAEIFKANVCEKDCVMRRTMKTGKSIVNEVITILRADGKPLKLSVSTALLKDGEGNVIGGVETFRDISIEIELRKKLEKSYSFEDILSKNHKMWELFDVLPDIAESDSTVLIEGESGTGKELFARALHNLSARHDKPLVTVNCGALPDSLLEAELFGYKAGAFTDARKDKPGRFAMARGGTIFLDEIGDVSRAMQARLLRVLQEGVYEPLGGTETEEADVRVIAATNQSLKGLVDAGKFRQDLYYRIDVVRLDIPPLVSRIEDVPVLVRHFVDMFNTLKNKNIKGVSADVMAVLMGYGFPGNVRELENIIEHAFVLCRGDLIGVEHLPGFLRKEKEKSEVSKVSSLDELTSAFIKDVLRRNNWSRKKTARQLGIHETTLWRKIKRLNIDLPRVDGRGSKKGE